MAKKMDFWPRQLIRRLFKPSVDQESVSCSSDESLSDSDDDVHTAPDVPMLVRRISETLFSDHINTEEIKYRRNNYNLSKKGGGGDMERRWTKPPERSGGGFVARCHNRGRTRRYLRDRVPPSRSINVAGIQGDDLLEPGARNEVRLFLSELGGEHAAAVKWENIIRRSINRSKPSSLPVASKKNRRRISCEGANGETCSSSISCSLQGVAAPPASRFVRIASRQMVGIFITVWARSGIRPAIRNVKVSCVGRGLMGYLGNKGSISVSLSVHETSFCFVCSHLTSGEREGDELRRNGDVTEILRRTYFSRPKFTWPDMPETIMGHDRIIWLGDLNYRLTLPDAQTRLLIAKGDWQTLLSRDQLRIEMKARRVFDGWQEGSIDFPPTYKYVIDSNRYSGLLHNAGEKRRTPSWCDRILWYGKGLKQLQYRRSESRFSDHRPVSATFLAQVEVFEDSKLKRLWSFSRTHEKTEEMHTFREPSMGVLADSAAQNHDSEVVSPIAVF